MVLGTFKPAHPCGESGLGASTGTMGLSWVRMQLSGLLWCWHNGHVPLLGRGKSPATLLTLHGRRGVLEGQEAISLCDREERLGP